MVKELEMAGLPTAHITNMTPVAKVTGSNRIVPGIAITNPVSDVNLPLNEQKVNRRKLLDRSLAAVATNVDEPTFF